MRVRVQGRRRLRMTERPLDRDHVAACRDQPTGIEVPQVVETDSRQARRLQCSPPPVANRVLMWRLTAVTHEEPAVLSGRRLFNVARKDLHQLFGEEDAPLRSVLW